MFRPVIQDIGPAIEPDHVWHRRGRDVRLERQAHTLEQAENVKLAVELHVPDDNLVARKIVDMDDYAVARRAQSSRQVS